MGVILNTLFTILVGTLVTILFIIRVGTLVTTLFIIRVGAGVGVGRVGALVTARRWSRIQLPPRINRLQPPTDQLPSRLRHILRRVYIRQQTMQRIRVNKRTRKHRPPPTS